MLIHRTKISTVKLKITGKKNVREAMAIGEKNTVQSGNNDTFSIRFMMNIQSLLH